MTRKRYLLLLLFQALALLAFAQGKTNRAYWSYIDKYKNLALEQQQKYRIPASITLAQGLLESGAGQSRLAREANNHFGIKTPGGWTGPYIRVDDDRPNEKFRKYKSVRDSYEDHSLFLKKPRYQRLFTYKMTDYKAWAHGLKACGYATSPTYAQNLIRIIEMYSLHQFDTKKGKNFRIEDLYDYSGSNGGGYASQGGSNILNNMLSQGILSKGGSHVTHRLSRGYLKRLARGKIKPKKIPEFFRSHTVYENNDNYFIVIQEGDSFAAISRATGIPVEDLLEYNDIDLSYNLSVGDILYMRKKLTKGAKEYSHTPHIVEPGQSMYDISQMYGIRLKNLYKLNGLSPKTYQIKVGDMIWLR